MAEYILFNTTEAVIEVLWDIALAFFIVKISLAYFSVPFLTWVLFSYLTTTGLLPLNPITPTKYDLLLILPQLLVIAAWARFTIAHYEVPMNYQFRLAIGGLSTVFIVAAEALTTLLLHAEIATGWVWERECRLGLLNAGLCAAFFFMPAGYMAMETRYRRHRETHHGHENKTLLNAIPTVSLRQEKMTKSTKKA